jgi:hypothetical protein
MSVALLSVGKGALFATWPFFLLRLTETRTFLKQFPSKRTSSTISIKQNIWDLRISREWRFKCWSSHLWYSIQTDFSVVLYSKRPQHEQKIWQMILFISKFPILVLNYHAYHIANSLFMFQECLESLWVTHFRLSSKNMRSQMSAYD